MHRPVALAAVLALAATAQADPRFSYKAKAARGQRQQELENMYRRVVQKTCNHLKGKRVRLSGAERKLIGKLARLRIASFWVEGGVITGRGPGVEARLQPRGQGPLCRLRIFDTDKNGWRLGTFREETYQGGQYESRRRVSAGRGLAARYADLGLKRGELLELRTDTRGSVTGARRTRAARVADLDGENAWIDVSRRPPRPEGVRAALSRLANERAPVISEGGKSARTRSHGSPSRLHEKTQSYTDRNGQRQPVLGRFSPRRRWSSTPGRAQTASTDMCSGAAVGRATSK
jgi:hypothetical protein